FLGGRSQRAIGMMRADRQSQQLSAAEQPSLIWTVTAVWTFSGQLLPHNVCSAAPEVNSLRLRISRGLWRRSSVARLLAPLLETMTMTASLICSSYATA